MRCVCLPKKIQVYHYYFTDVAELDICDEKAVAAYIEEHLIDIVVNCAAYTNVDRAEDDFAMADLLNNKAVENLAVAAAETGATLIHVSTDYVFRGDKNIPCRESWETDPLGVYGKTKLAGEQSLVKAGCKYLISAQLGFTRLSVRTS